ncbi:COG1361 S-layer family protein [Halobacterium litoreum]|uniref:COG1361 S-layer family protein n=1 Tax=Halobacterium litoreum TaxID=2039234 RepID=A0ABD5NDX7_9EURY|nr:FxLYD domain-containing protein [Halobacterium litoreum]UHH13690.1 FxLYD domain-containing protein [Halobacterium litoreum]
MSRDRRVLAVAVACMFVVGAFGVVAGDAPTLAGGGDCDDDHDDTTTTTTTTTEDCDDDPTTTTRKTTKRTTTKRPPKTTEEPEDVTVEGEPDLSAFLPENTVSPGEETRLVVQLSNGGTVDDGGLDTPPEGEDAVTTARNVEVELEDGDAPVTIQTGTTPLGDLPAGAIGEAGFDVVVDEDADPGVYELDVTVDYDYTEEISNDDRDEESETETFELDLVVTEDARFEVVDVDEDLQVGETGTVEVTLENVGEEDLRDATVTIRSRNRDLTVDSGFNATRYIGDWDDGDEETVEIEATALNTSAPQRYALSAVVEYTDEDGDPQRAVPRPFGVRIDDEQAFDVDDVEGDLRVGEDGAVVGTVTNDGPQPVADAVVRLVDGDGDVVARRAAVVGDLDDGESEDFRIPVRVPADAEPGERRLSFVVDYVNRDGDARRSDPLFDTATVLDERDDFAVSDVEESLQVGETGTVELTLANLLDEDVTDATVTVRSPNADLRLGGDGEATRYVGDWDEADLETVAVEATVADGAGTQRYPLEVTVSYTDEDGDDQTSDVLVVSVTPDGEQGFAVEDVTSTLRVGEEGRVNGTVRNLGPSHVETAVLRVTGTDDNLRPRERTVVLGDLLVGDEADFSVPASVLDTAQPGQRRLTVVVEYVTPAGDRRESDPISVVAAASSETARFELATVDADLQAADDGTLALEVVNRGNETLTDATVSLTSRSTSLLVGDGVNDTRFVGRWPTGERRIVRYRVRAGNETGNQTYAFEASVAFEDEEGQPQRSDALAFGATPADEQAFAAETVESTLRVGEEGRVRVALTNTGPANVTAAGVTLVTDAPNVAPVETEAAVGDLAAGDVVAFELPVEITENAGPGVRQFAYRVQYTDDDGDRRTSDRLTTDVRVAPEREAFVVERETVSATAGQSTVVELTVTNNRGVTVTEIQAKAFADDPLSVSDDQAFVAALEPNESATIRFTVSPAGSAGEKAYPLSVDFLYTTPDGDTELSEPVNVGVDVDRPPPSALPAWVLPAVALLVVLVAVALVIRHRRSQRAGEDDAASDGENDETDGGADDGETDGGTDDGSSWFGDDENG